MSDTDYEESEVEIIDPATELAEFCQWLFSQNSTNQKTADFLAQMTNTQAWSAEFYEVVIFINEKIEALDKLVQSAPIGHNLKTLATPKLNNIKSAFSDSGLHAVWWDNNRGMKKRLSEENWLPIQMLSPALEPLCSYPKLSENDVAHIQNECAILRQWLDEHQLRQHDFIRQMIIDGLQKFHTRLDRVPNLGTNYATEGLHELVVAYMMLERGEKPNGGSPDVSAMAKKVGSTLQSVYSKVKAAKEGFETADWIIRSYAALSFVRDPTIMGLIPTS